MADRWGNSGTVADLIFLGSKITAHGDCSHEIKKTIASWKKAYDKPRQCIKKQTYHFADKGLSSQSYGFFPIVMYGCESWTVKKDEHQRINTFELWCWRRLLKVPWRARRSKHPLDSKEIKAVNPKGYQPWIFTGWIDAKTEATILWPPDAEEPTHWKRSWCWGRLKAKREGGQRIRWLYSIMNSMDKNLSKL